MTKNKLPILDERGVALPLALFGLVAVSLLVTTALVTSSTEVALSRAHQEGTRALYAADGALERFVAERAAMVTTPELRLASGTYQTTDVLGGQYSVAVGDLFRGPPEPLPNGDVQRRETYSLVAEPQAGSGRGVGALIEVTRLATSMSFNIDSGLTVGTNTTITGNATISSGGPTAACDSAAAPAAIRHADGTTISQVGSAHEIQGSIVEDALGPEQLMAQMLNGHSIEDLTELANIKWGPMFGKPSLPGGAGPTHLASNPDLRWGCPALLVTGCPADHAAYFPTVVIDAAGGEVDISNYHGQGILLIRNGGLHISGSFKYGGIILVEGALRVTGGGGGEKKLEGAVIVMGDETVIDPGDESTTTGNSLIRFDKCQIVDAQRGLTIQSLDSSAQLMDTPTFAWYEVVR